MNQKIKIIICMVLCYYFHPTYAQLKQITGAEYFWDTDPGTGNGSPLAASGGSYTESIETAILNTSSLPAIGNHIFHVRFKDINNNWSPVFKTVINVLPGINTVRNIKVSDAEYFWDTDPGAGNATPMIAFDGAFDESIEEVLKNNVSIPTTTGIHQFNVRVKDDANNWTSTFKTLIDIQSNITTVRTIKVTAAEYFWDSDPGAGNASPMIAFDGAFDESIEEILKNNVSIPAVIGPHIFNIRIKDAANNWSAIFKTIIDIQNNITTIRNIKVTAAEYFWDADPGAGNATPMIAFDGAFDESIEEILKNNVSIPVSTGPHVLNIRVKDVSNNWSTTFKTVIDIESNISTVRNIKITSGEYFWDNDPGAGNATAMLAFDGNFNASFEQIIGGAIPSPVAQGVHVLYTRARDAENYWGPAFGIVVNMDTSINAINVQINGYTSLCQNDLNNVIYNTPLNGTNTYDWIITGGTIVNGQNTNQITVNWNPTGPYQLKLIECSTSPAICDSDIITLNVLPVAASNASAAICLGQSIFLGGALQTQPGIYDDIYTAANGCDSIVSTTLTVYPVYNTTNNVSICQGDSFYVAGQFQHTSGTYIDYLSTIHNCDSIVTTNLTVSPALNYITNAGICNGDSIYFNGSYYSQAGSYSFTYQTPSGCDSILTLVLTIDPGYSINNAASICNGDSTYFNGNYYSQAGIYSFNYQSSNGCDSTITLQLDVNPTYVNSNNININSGDSIYAGGAWQTATGTYYDSLLTVNGCDSVIITNLTVINGIYNPGNNELISVYPNPFNNHIELYSAKPYEITVDVVLTDAIGKVICSWNHIKFLNHTVLKTGSIVAGSYMLSIKADNVIIKKFLIKQ